MKNCSFRVRAIVSDNHSAKVLAYKLLLEKSGHLDDHLFMQHNYQKIYWLHHVAHLIKNVTNNLFNHKASYFQLLNTMALMIKFYLKLVKCLGNYITENVLIYLAIFHESI